jgi:regulatory protein
VALVVRLPATVSDDEGSEKDARRQALEAALRLLRHRGRSRHELRGALERRGFGESVQEDTLRRLHELGYLDDAKFARQRATTLLREGKLAGAAILERLEAHGIPEADAKAALAGAQEEAGYDPLAAARALLERRGLWGRTLSEKDRARAARTLAQRGFPEDIVERLLGEP